MHEKLVNKKMEMKMKMGLKTEEMEKRVFRKSQ